MENISFSDKIETIRSFKNRINITAACATAGYSSQTYINAMRRADNRYTDAEIAVVEAVYNAVCEKLEYRRSIGIAV